MEDSRPESYQATVLGSLTELEWKIRALERELDRRAKSLGITGPQRRALATLAQMERTGEPITVKTFAEHQRIDRASASQIIYRLVKSGLVEPRRHDQDRRRVVFASTATGADAISHLERAYAEIAAAQPATGLLESIVRAVRQVPRRGPAGEIST
ncbi:MAG: MarR family winged helix-turn-helix transcriptional regulator [Candidatus Dormibacteria bacterium]